MTGVPANIIIPFVGVEFDSSRANAGPAEVPVQLFVIGQRLASGTVPAETKFYATTADEVADGAGFGSMLHRMAIKAFKNSGTVPITFVGLDDAGGSTPATHTLDFGGAATKVGEVPLYVAGQRYAVSVEVGDTGDDVGAALAAALTEDVDNLPVTAAFASPTLTLTLKNSGIAAGDLDVRVNYNRGERTPAGITVSAVTTTPGTVDPDVTDALATIGADWYNVIANPFTDNTNMNAIEELLATNAGPMEQRASVCYQAVRDTLSALITYGTDVANRNSQWMATYAAYQRLESTYEIAAGVAAAVASSVQDDAAVPLHRINLVGFKVLDSNDKWDAIERNSLAKASISTFTDENGVQTEACVTMYRENSAGAADPAYRQQNVPFILSALRYRFVNHILTKYPRAKLADSADGLGAGQQIMTPGIGQTEAVAWFRQAQFDGLVEGGQAAIDQFKSELVVQRDTTNLDRMNWLLPPDLMNQFIVGSGVLQFRS